MSVRTEPRADLSERLHGALHISADQLAQQGIKLEQSPASGAAMGGGLAETGGAVQLPNEHALAEANSFNVSNPEYPLTRTMVVSIRASLNDLCLRKQAATWAPNADAVKSILQQRKFVDLAGSAENQGDLKSIVLHKLELSAQKSSFPTALGLRVTGVDDATFSLTGDAYSAIAMPNADTHVSRVLQEDDTSLAYEFVRRAPLTHTHTLHSHHTRSCAGAEVPGCKSPPPPRTTARAVSHVALGSQYTAENLSEKGIHEASSMLQHHTTRRCTNHTLPPNTGHRAPLLPGLGRPPAGFRHRRKVPLALEPSSLPELTSAACVLQRGEAADGRDLYDVRYPTHFMPSEKLSM